MIVTTRIFITTLKPEPMGVFLPAGYSSQSNVLLDAKVDNKKQREDVEILPNMIPTVKIAQDIYQKGHDLLS